MTDNVNPSEEEKDDLATDLKRANEGVDPPPFFNTWKAMYALVIGVFVVLVVLFYLFTKFYE
jgi:hypothetical protein